MSLFDLLIPRAAKPSLEKTIERFDELQRELEKRVDRLEGTKAQLLSHANGAYYKLNTPKADSNQG